MQIFGHSPSTEMSTFHVLNETYNKYNDKVDFLLISKQIGKTKPATLFFISKFGCEIDKVVFYNKLNKDKIWDEFDVLITANPELLEEHENKTTIKSHIKSILAYSPKKKRAKPIAEYSTL